MSIKPRETLDRELRHLEDETLALASMVENAITASVEVLKRRDMEGSQRLIAEDRLINQKRFAIEDEALVLIATQQPIATDLRMIAAVLDIAHELERIGDYAKGIAKINLLIGEEPLIKPLLDIPHMAVKTRAMLHKALEAFAERDAGMAQAIPDEDDEVDSLYNQVYRELVTYILEDPSVIERANYLLWVAHNLERSADRVTNICERVIFTVTGEVVELDVKEGEGVSLEGIR
jgi:phosphate transport system protein